MSVFLSYDYIYILCFFQCTDRFNRRDRMPPSCYKPTGRGTQSYTVRSQCISNPTLLSQQRSFNLIYSFILWFFNTQSVLINAIGGLAVVLDHLGEVLSRTLIGLMVFLIPHFYRSKESLTYFTVSSYDFSIRRASYWRDRWSLSCHKPPGRSTQSYTVCPHGISNPTLLSQQRSPHLLQFFILWLLFH